jgi:HNH endonuclease/NUMOD4 motif-containing protein
MEEWRSTFHPFYDVSNLGRIRSWYAQGGDYRNLRTPRRRESPKILRPGIASHGYPTISFGCGYGSQCVHVLVATAFLGPCPKGQECRHKDDNRANPKADNLEYGTRLQNVHDMHERGRYVCAAKTLLRDWHGRLVAR